MYVPGSSCVGVSKETSICPAMLDWYCVCAWKMLGCFCDTEMVNCASEFTLLTETAIDRIAGGDWSPGLAVA